MNSNYIILHILNANTLWYIGVYTWLKKIWGKTLSQSEDYIMEIFKKQVFKQAIGRAEKKTEILVIPNRNKDTLKDLIDSSDIEPLI